MRNTSSDQECSFACCDKQSWSRSLKCFSRIWFLPAFVGLVLMLVGDAQIESANRWHAEVAARFTETTCAVVHYGWYYSGERCNETSNDTSNGTARSGSRVVRYQLKYFGDEYGFAYIYAPSCSTLESEQYADEFGTGVDSVQMSTADWEEQPLNPAWLESDFIKGNHLIRGDDTNFTKVCDYDSYYYQWGSEDEHGSPMYDVDDLDIETDAVQEIELQLQQTCWVEADCASPQLSDPWWNQSYYDGKKNSGQQNVGWGIALWVVVGLWGCWELRKNRWGCGNCVWSWAAIATCGLTIFLFTLCCTDEQVCTGGGGRCGGYRGCGQYSCGDGVDCNDCDCDCDCSDCGGCDLGGDCAIM